MTMWQTNRGLKTWWQRVYNGASGSAREAGNERNPIVARWSFGVLNPRNTTDVPGNDKISKESKKCKVLHPNVNSRDCCALN